MNFLETSEQIGKELRSIHRRWDGRESILEMKEADYQWRQMEWVGFYFEFLCEKCLSGVMEIPGPRYGRVRFDAFKDVPWDFKAHAMEPGSNKIIVNDREAIVNGIEDYGAVGLILALGEVSYDDNDRTFQKWHEALKGGLSKYSIERMDRGAPSRLRKVSFELQQISFIRITEGTLVKCGTFQRDFRNADGSPRREKVLLDLEEIDKDLIYPVKF